MNETHQYPTNTRNSEIEIAKRLAAKIRDRINAASDKKISHATLATSLALHITLEAIADELGIDKAWFKKECGVGQPLAYFV